MSTLEYFVRRALFGVTLGCVIGTLGTPIKTATVVVAAVLLYDFWVIPMAKEDEN